MVIYIYNKKMFLSKLLKIFSRIFSFPLVTYGFYLGVLGKGPDGQAPIEWQIFGIFCIVECFFYWIPNSYINNKEYLEKLFLIITCLPLFTLLIVVIYNVYFNSTLLSSDVQIYFGIITLFICFSLSPLSYLLFKVMRNSQCRSPGDN